jgi:hypothetical protein
MVKYYSEFHSIVNLIIDKLNQYLIDIVHIVNTMHDHQIVDYFQIKVSEYLTFYHQENVKHLHVSTIQCIDNHKYVQLLVFLSI